MSYKPFVSGAVSNVLADVLADKLPGTLDFAGLPVRRMLVSTAGAFAAHYAMNRKSSVMAAALTAVGAVAGGTIASKVGVAAVNVGLGPIGTVNVTSAVAGGAGAWAVSKFTKTKKDD